MTPASSQFRLREATADDSAAIPAVVAAVMAEHGLSADLEVADGRATQDGARCPGPPT
jgi:hypothetical protein